MTTRSLTPSTRITCFPRSFALRLFVRPTREQDLIDARTGTGRSQPPPALHAHRSPTTRFTRPEREDQVRVKTNALVSTRRSNADPTPPVRPGIECFTMLTTSNPARSCDPGHKSHCQTAVAYPIPSAEQSFRADINGWMPGNAAVGSVVCTRPDVPYPACAGIS